LKKYDFLDLTKVKYLNLIKLFKFKLLNLIFGVISFR
jgi:hypothetical protein